ncbi:hypothetical protein OROGR_019480 [Orobanche gracilis]
MLHSRSIHFISGSLAPDGRSVPCSGLPGRALDILPYSSHANHKPIPGVKFLSLRCSSRHNASSGSYVRKFSRNRNNRYNEERDGYEDLEESDSFSNRKGPLRSFPPNQKSQTTATPGPREKEIVELFKKVQAQLRERAAVKEEGKKVENCKGKSKESETVNSLLKLLRKHLVQQGKQSNISVDNNDFIPDQLEKVGASTEEKSTNISVSTNHVKHEDGLQESRRRNLSRPKSSFHKKSPVPEIKFQPIYPEGNVPHENPYSGNNQASLEPEAVDVEEVESDSDSDVNSLFSQGNDSCEISEDEISELYENEPDASAQNQNPCEAGDLGGMKLPELRAVAKSRGMKGYSKLKKRELIELLSG